MKTIEFARHYRVWPLVNRPKLNLFYVSSKGATVEELLDNAELSVEDWNGNSGPDLTVDELHQKDFEGLKLEFENALKGKE